MTAAEQLMQHNAKKYRWGASRVQQGLRVTLMILENIIGPEMGAGCPDRAVSIMTQWSVFDDRFHQPYRLSNRSVHAMLEELTKTLTIIGFPKLFL